MNRAVRLFSTAGIVLSLLVVATIVLLPGLARAQAEDEGQVVYTTNCSSCHQPDGLGIPGSFPPLSGNPNVQDAAYVKTVVTGGLSGPIEVLGETYDGVMPPFASLSDAEIDAVTAYIQADVFEAAGDGETLEPGDAATGEAVFLGANRLENAGPACVGCHTAASYQGLSGGTLGPDLTDLSVRYGGADAVAAALANPPSPTMQPIFVGAPITDQERADLAAYFDSISNAEISRSPVDLMLVGGVIGAIVFFALMLLAPRSRKTGFAEQLRSQR
ncbi:MAG: cytochrome c [Actinomycetia bacterium]|nr:cytochrome c [Actinomycetes bacterium]